MQDLPSDTKCCIENSYKYQKFTVDLKEPVFGREKGTVYRYNGDTSTY